MRPLATNNARPMSLPWHNSNRLNFEKELGMCESRNEYNGDRRRCRHLPEYLLKCAHRRVNRLPLDSKNCPFHDVLNARPCRREGNLKVGGNLRCLCSDVSPAHNGARGIDCVLAAYENSSGPTTGHYDLRERGVPVKPIRVEVSDSTLRLVPVLRDTSC